MRFRSPVLSAYGWNIRPFHDIMILQYSDLRMIKKGRCGTIEFRATGEGD